MDILRKYFYGKLSSTEEKHVQEWLLEHADEMQVQEELREIMFELEGDDERLSSEAFTKVCSRLGLDGRIHTAMKVRKFVRRFFTIAAILALPVFGAVTYAFLAPRPHTQWQEMKVPDGQTAQLALADGTLLHLNAGSRVTYPSEFIGDERRIFVEGEVFADVAEDPKRPFYINSGDVDVKVLGTTFNFKAYDNTECVELLLLKGTVQVDIDAKTRSKQLVLNHGEMVQYDRKSGEIDLKEFNYRQYKGFHKDGSIHFFNLRLSDIITDLERIFGTKIVLLDEKLAEKRYFAWFTNKETLEQILESIDVDGIMKFEMKNDVIYISRI